MPKLILGLAGLQGSGKGTVAELLQKEYGAKSYRFSSILGDILDRISVDKTRDNLIKLSEVLRQAFGQDVLSYAIGKEAILSPGSIIVVDGIRRPEDIVALEPLPQFKLLAIDVPTELRYERMKARGEKVGEATMTWEEFVGDERAITEMTTAHVMKRAAFTIKNDGTREEFEEKIRALVKKLDM